MLKNDTENTEESLQQQTEQISISPENQGKRFMEENEDETTESGEGAPPAKKLKTEDQDTSENNIIPIGTQTNSTDNSDTIFAQSDDSTFNAFVGDLDPEVTEEDLQTIFSPCGPISSVMVFRDKVTNEPKGFGFVHFTTESALQVALNPPYSNVEIKGRVCRVKPEQKTSLFIGNLPKDKDEAGIKEMLEQYTTPIMTVQLKTGPPPQCNSRGFAFITFGNHTLADRARKALTQSSVKENLSVAWAEARPEIDESIMESVKTLYVTNLSGNSSEETLEELFSPFGEIENKMVVKDPEGNSRGFGFVEFATREECLKALTLDRHTYNGQQLSVALAKPPKTGGDRFANKGATRHRSHGPRDNPRAGCFRCGYQGHLAKDCPSHPENRRARIQEHKKARAELAARYPMGFPPQAMYPPGFPGMPLPYGAPPPFGAAYGYPPIAAGYGTQQSPSAYRQQQAQGPTQQQGAAQQQGVAQQQGPAQQQAQPAPATYSTPAQQYQAAYTSAATQQTYQQAQPETSYGTTPQATSQTYGSTESAQTPAYANPYAAYGTQPTAYSTQPTSAATQQAYQAYQQYYSPAATQQQDPASYYGYQYPTQ